MKDAHRYAEELGTTLTLEPATSSCSSQSNPEKTITGHHVKQILKEAVSTRLVKKVVDQKWHDRLLSSRWSDDQLSERGCVAWLTGWSCAPTHTVAGASDRNNIMCRMCGKAPECIAHVLAGCSWLAQTKYLERHNAALKVLFFEIIRDLDLNETAFLVFAHRAQADV